MCVRACKCECVHFLVCIYVSIHSHIYVVYRPVCTIVQIVIQLDT